MSEPAIKLIAMESLVVHVFSDGVIDCVHNRMDQATRRMIPHEMFRTLQDHQDPFTNPDLLFIGAAELVATELGYNYRLPF
jgi:hypothetical protein